MPLLRMTQNDVDEAITIDQLLAEIELAKEAGLVTGATKVVMSQLCGHNIFPVRAVIALGPTSGEPDVLAISVDSEDVLLASGKFGLHAE